MNTIAARRSAAHPGPHQSSLAASRRFAFRLAAMHNTRRDANNAFVLVRSLAAVPAALLFVGAAHAQPQTTVPASVLSIHVTITDSRITLSRHGVPRGVEGRFVITNIGTKKHNFTLATGAPGLGTTPLLTRTLAPHKQAVVPLFFDYRGDVRYLDRLAADRNKPGMRGVFVVQ
jgi:hypothetical protein